MCADMPARHAAWRQGRHAARCRSVHQSAQLARSDAGDPCALLVALDEWVVNGREPPPSRLPRIADGTLVHAEAVAWPKLAALVPPRAANDVVALGDWTDPRPPAHAWQALVPQVDADGNEIAGIRLPDIAVPRGTFTGWNLYKSPLPEGELGSRRHTPCARIHAAERERTIRGCGWRALSDPGCACLAFGRRSPSCDSIGCCWKRTLPHVATGRD